MIKTSKHNISNITNISKLQYLDKMFLYYKHDLLIYINYIIDGVLPLKKMMSSKELPSELIKHSKYKRDIYKKASEIIRSQLKKSTNKRYKRYKYIYRYFKLNNRQNKFTDKKFSELNLKDILKTKHFTHPIINEISINLTNEFFDIEEGIYFDNFINLKLPFFNEKGTRAIKLNIPLKKHRHSNKLSNNGFNLRNNIQIKKVNGQYFINLVWGKEDYVRTTGKSLGIDMGYKKLIVSSDGQFIGGDMIKLYNKISKKVQGSINFKQSLTERDNLINYYINQMDLSEVSRLIIENLKEVKKGSKGKINKSFNNKLQRWSYLKTINKLESICLENGIELVKVSPYNTSIACSSCGAVDKKSRVKEDFICTRCEYKIDADLNASINIHNRGVYSPSN